MGDDLTSRIDDLERRIAALEATIQRTPPVPTTAKPLSIREFFNTKAPKTSVDAALVIGYYLEKFTEATPFNLDDLNNGYAMAKEKPPLNPSDMILKNARKGYIMEARGKKNGTKSWILTNTGEKYVENGLKEG